MEFLFDDEWIEFKAGVTRVLGAVNKSPRPILTPDMPWENGGIGGTSVIFDEEEGVFKIWFRSSVISEDSESGGRAFLCYGVSRDGINWSRPSLGLFEFKGSRDNNIVRELAFEADATFFNILKDPEDPDPFRRYKALGFDDSVTSSIRDREDGARGVCVSYSPDGFHWEDPKLVVSTDDLTDCDCILNRREPTTGRWLGFFRPRTHPKRRFIGLSESDDFDHWSYPRMLMRPDDGDEPWTEFYGLTMACFGRWRIGCLWVMRNNPDYSPMTVELAYSRDGFNYHRAMPRTQFLPLGPDGSEDSRLIMPIALIKRENDVLLYYHGRNQEHGSDRTGDGIGGVQMPKGRVEGDEPRSIMGVALIPGRNFCGLRAEGDGLVETKWLCNYGDGGVKAHAEVEPGGWIRAEILDQYGRVIPGWGRDECSVSREAGGRLRFSWGREDLVGNFGQTSEAEGLIGHVVKLRFLLYRATLYAFQIGEEGAMPPYG